MPTPVDLDLATFTRQSKLFSLLDPVGRQRLLDAAEQITFEPEAVVCREGEAGDAIFVVQSGTVRVSVEGIDGHQEVAKLGAGSVFGEIAVVMDQPRSATITADATVLALRFAKEPVRAVLKDYPAVREVLARLGLKRSELTLEKLLELDASAADAVDGDDDPGANG